MILCKCAISDLRQLREISEQTYRDTFALYNSKEDMDAYISSAFSVDTLRDSLENNASRYYLAKDNGITIGYIKLNFASAQTDIHDDMSIELERIYILREHQGKGYGNILLKKAIQEAHAFGKSYIWLGVWEKNMRAIRFYEQNGFYRFGEHVFIMGNDSQTDYLMKKIL